MTTQHAYDRTKFHEDRLMGARLRLLQPKNGFRVSPDTFFLAASIRALPKQHILELGSGVGGASLALHIRVPNLNLYGLEIQREYTEISRINAAYNDANFTAYHGNVCVPPSALKMQSFDHVFANPPFFPISASPSPIVSRDRGQRLQETLDAWVNTGLKRLRQGGSLTIINRIETLPELLISLHGRAGAIRVLPLQARETHSPKRFLLRAIKDSRASFSMASPFILHKGKHHVKDGNDFTDKANALLKDANALDF